MKAPEVTDDVKTGLELMKLRSVITPKRFYKKDDRKGLPKHFQVCKVNVKNFGPFIPT